MSEGATITRSPNSHSVPPAAAAAAAAANSTERQTTSGTSGSSSSAGRTSGGRGSSSSRSGRGRATTGGRFATSNARGSGNSSSNGGRGSRGGRGRTSTTRSTAGGNQAKDKGTAIDSTTPERQNGSTATNTATTTHEGTATAIIPRGGGRSSSSSRGGGRGRGRGRSRSTSPNGGARGGRGGSSSGQRRGGRGTGGRGGRGGGQPDSPATAHATPTNCDPDTVVKKNTPSPVQRETTEHTNGAAAKVHQLNTLAQQLSVEFPEEHTTAAARIAVAVVVVPPSQPQQHLNLPTPPTAASLGKGNNNKNNGVPMILSRQTHPPPLVVLQSPPPPPPPLQDDYESHAQRLSERLAEAALLEDDDDDVHVPLLPAAAAAAAAEPKQEQQPAPSSSATDAEPAALKKEKKKRPPKKKKSVVTEDAAPPVVVEVAPVSATEALRALPAQEVSITASTQVKIARNESNASLNNNNQDYNASPSKILPETKSAKSGKKGLTGDAKSNRTAARRFNNEVRFCVENSDPDSMRAILHDKHNHKFALDAVVLETVMKAYVMAAMFDDALYCLRNCTLPATLQTAQTERILTCMPQNLRSSNAYTAADMINALCIATVFDTPTARTYFLRIVRGIALEFLEEAMSARDRICSAPCERLVRAGTCVVEARLTRGKKASDLIVVPGDQLGVWQADTMENRGIQAGDAVSILPYAGPYPMSAESLDRNMIEATITNTNPMVLRLQDKTNASLHAMLTESIEGNVFRIDKLANRMGFNRQLTAAVAIASPVGDTSSKTYVRDTRRPCPQLIKAVTAMDENIDQVMKVAASAKMSNTTLTSTAELCAEAIPWSIADENEDMDQDSIRAASRLALEKYGALEGLNESQQLAVEGATSNRLTLVQGPPGTGKTRIAIRILEQWARLAAATASEKGEDPTPILATSDSNIAVDNLVEGCAAVGLRVVRLGRPEAIRPELLRFCIDRPPSSYDNSRNGANGQNSPFGGSSNNGYKERMKQLKGAQIICCTCIGSGGDILDSLGPLERILVDEATQATEPAVLVPLMRGCRQLVLVGDHCQLPPTVLSTRAEEEGHGVPLFSRMVACGVPPFMLDTQYRMHPGIAMFPSDLFYGGLLKNGVSAPERRPLAGFPWPREEFPIAFIPVKGVEMDDGVSKFNEAEAEAACEAVRMLLQGGQCSVSDIAVVTPYAAQARLIRRMTRRMTSNSGPPFIEVSSVDGFQGREKEAVVFSAVRSNDYGAIGFTSDWRRINVSFTRARRALIVIGNDHTLRRGDPDTWMPWLAWADAHGVNMDKPGIARGRYEPEQLRRVRGGTTAAEMLKDVLARQQAQLKQAEHQQERAVKNSAGHIIGGTGDEDEEGGASTPKVLTLEEDLARLENTDGNWDDSDDEDDIKKKVLAHSGSKATLASAASSNDFRMSDESNDAVDVWDL